MSEIHLKIDNQPISAPEGTTILIAAAKAGASAGLFCRPIDLPYYSGIAG